MAQALLMAAMMIGGTEFMDDCLGNGGEVAGLTRKYPASSTETSVYRVSGATLTFDFEDDELNVVVVGVFGGGIIGVAKTMMTQ